MKKPRPPRSAPAAAPADRGPLPLVACAYTELVAPSDLLPHPRNPNTHPPGQIELLAKVIAGNGWRSPIVVSNLSGRVIKGHGRLAAAKLAGWALVPVDRQDYPDAAAELADLVADNRLAELSEISVPDLKELLAELGTAGLDLELAGFTDLEFERVMASLNDKGAPDPRAEWAGMPECESEDQTAFASLRVNFASAADRDAFAALVKQTVTEKTRSIWFPPAPIGRYADKRYADEGAPT